jgi:hypothetical protein
MERVMEGKEYYMVATLGAVRFYSSQDPGMKRVQQITIPQKEGDQVGSGPPPQINLEFLGRLPDRLRDIRIHPAGSVYHPPRGRETDTR